MQSLQHYTGLAIFTQNVDYSDLPLDFYLNNLGLPRVEIIQRMQRENTKDPNDGLQIAAEMGCMHSLLFFKSIGATAYGIYVAMGKAALNGHIEVVTQCKEWGADNIHGALNLAARNGHIDIIKQCKKWGFNNYSRDCAMEVTVCMGHIDVVLLFKKWGTPCTKYTWTNASCAGQYDIVKLLLEWDPTHINDGMKCAASQGYINIVQLCLDNGATSYARTISTAVTCGDIEMINLFKGRVPDKYIENAIAEAAPWVELFKYGSGPLFDKRKKIRSSRGISTQCGN